MRKERIKILKNNDGTITAVDARIDMEDINRFENKFMPYGIQIESDFWEDTSELDPTACEDEKIIEEAVAVFESILRPVVRKQSLCMNRY